MRGRAARAIAGDSGGSTIVEFAIVAPVLCLFLVGALDVAHTLYMQTALEGEVQKAARDAALETGASEGADVALDTKVKKQVEELYHGITFTTTRRYYRTFSKAREALEEPYTDNDKNGTCDNEDPYQDTNNNNSWDDDGADNGQGGAQDRVLYTVKISYPRVLPLFKWIGVSDTVSIQAKTVLQNQPYGEQATDSTPTWRNCA